MKFFIMIKGTDRLGRLYMKRAMKKKSGLTLIEVIISLAILGIIITPFLSMGLSTVNLGEKSKEKQQALIIAQEYMEKIKSPEFKISKLDAEEASEGISKEVTRGGKKYLVKYKIESLKQEEKIEKVKFQYILEIEDGVKVYKKSGEEKTLLNEIGSLFDESEKLVIQKKNDGIIFEIDTNEGRDNTIKVEDNINDLQVLNIGLYNTSDNKINLDIKNYQGELNLYMDSQEFYNINSSLGKINYIFNYNENGEETYGNLFRVNITVSKKNFKGNEEILQTLEGYKRY